MSAIGISKKCPVFSIDFNFIYGILNIVKTNKKGEPNWR